MDRMNLFWLQECVIGCYRMCYIPKTNGKTEVESDGKRNE